MNLFELLFVLLFLGTVGTLVGVLVLAVRGRFRRALGVLVVLGVVLAVYIGAVVIVSVASPQRVIPLGEAQCFDDWCIAVDHVEQSAAGQEISYEVTLRLSSRARGRPQRESGVGVYALDALRRRFEAENDPGATGLDVSIDPGGSVTTTRRFVLPADARDPGLVVAHGWFPGAFIIGDAQSLLHKPTVVRLR